MQNKRQKLYEQIVIEYKYPTKSRQNIIKSFIYGGLICLFGQGLLFALEKFGFEGKEASLVMSLTLILIASIMTGFGIYDILGKEAHSGTLIPITGFANAMTSSAIDFRGEGYLIGVSANIFKLAGVVIVVSIVSGFIVALIRWLGGI